MQVAPALAHGVMTANGRQPVPDGWQRILPVYRAASLPRWSTISSASAVRPSAGSIPATFNPCARPVTAAKRQRWMAALAVVEIVRFYLANSPGDRSDVIARFDVRVGDFLIRNGSLRLPHDSGDAFVAMPGKATCGISIAQPSETRDIIHAAVCARYRAETGRWP